MLPHRETTRRLLVCPCVCSCLRSLASLGSGLLETNSSVPVEPGLAMLILCHAGQTILIYASLWVCLDGNQNCPTKLLALSHRLGLCLDAFQTSYLRRYFGHPVVFRARGLPLVGPVQAQSKHLLCFHHSRYTRLYFGVLAKLYGFLLVT